MSKTITHNESGEAKFGDQDHLQVSQARTFSEMIFELLSEKAPTKEELQLFDLILNLSIDHGPDSPSAAATIEAAKEGKSLGEAVGVGVSQINDQHGGAMEPLMEALYKVQSSKLKVKSLVEDYIKEGKRIPGLGHRIYKDKDPRAELLMETALSLKVGEEYIRIVREIRDEFEKQSGKSLVINIDGAIAAVLCGFGWPSKLGKAVFIIARTPGLCSHYLNTKTS
ncbi:MAG: citryl-CoA lyase [Candidatus Daviesbacteria bacterium]|nr:citryl-CoA lyase [Candidatus Daviesbacteria bacterium]